MIIEVVLNILAVGAFLLGLLGIGLIVMNASRGRGIQGGIVLAVIGFVVGALSLIASEGLLIVGPTERAVVFNSVSGDLEDVRDPGFHIVIPGVQQTIIYSIAQQEYTMSGDPGEGNRTANDDAVQARSADGQEVFVDLTILFSIDPASVNIVHTRWSTLSQGYTEGLIRPVVRAVVREVIATVRAEDIFGNAPIVGDSEEAQISPLERVQQEIESRIREDLLDEGFLVSDVLLREINFSEDFVQAIERRQVAELERDRASIEAETARIEAAGLADARIERARGDAEAVRIQAQAEAEALQLVSEQIAANPNLIQYTYITELGDNVSLVLIPSNSPFLFDPASFTDLGEDFQAPIQPSQTEEPETETEGN